MRIITNQILTLNEVAKITGSPLQKSDIPINAIVTNSKEAQKNDLFIALKGDVFCGEDFVKEAAQNGAFILSVRDKKAEITVPSAEAALLNIASYYKRKLKNLRYTIAITGSVGKTTAKNILSEVLKSKYTVHSTYKNYNNYLGVSHTVLTAPIDCEILVIEMGMNHLREISMLSSAVSPNISVITNIGTAHIGNLGNRETIAKAKLEIADGMTSPLIIVPTEETLLMKAEGRYGFSISGENADCFLKNIKEDECGTVFDILTKTHEIRNLRINIPGKHILSSVAIAASVLDAAGDDLTILREALPEIKGERVVRAKMLKCGKYNVYDDTYSASYEATIANFELLAQKKQKMCCVLGDMLELGAQTKLLHEKIGAAVFKYGFKRLFTFGKSATNIAIGAQRAGMLREFIFINEDIDKPQITAEQINNNCTSEELLFFKASHAVHAEKILEFLN